VVDACHLGIYQDEAVRRKKQRKEKKVIGSYDVAPTKKQGGGIMNTQVCHLTTLM